MPDSPLTFGGEYGIMGRGRKSSIFNDLQPTRRPEQRHEQPTRTDQRHTAPTRYAEIEFWQTVMKRFFNTASRIESERQRRKLHAEIKKAERYAALLEAYQTLEIRELVSTKFSLKSNISRSSGWE